MGLQWAPVYSRAVRYWLPPILWAGVILWASGDAFSAEHTGSILQAIVTAIRGRPLSPEQFATVHFLIRKAAHLTEYGILGGLLFRAIRRARPGFDWRWAATAIVVATCLSSIDEFHQTFVASRTGNPIDVGLDTLGASLAQIVVWLKVRR